MSWAEDWHVAVTRVVERRKMLCRAAPLCPGCRRGQSQLLFWAEGPLARWRCRLCRLKFVFEPLVRR